MAKKRVDALCEELNQIKGTDYKVEKGRALVWYSGGCQHDVKRLETTREMECFLEGAIWQA